MKKVLIFILGIVVGVVGSIAYVDWKQQPEEIGKMGPVYEPEKLVVPESVNLSLNYEDGNYPVLELSTPAGSGCDKVSNLDISRTSKEGTMFVSIQGYTYERYIGDRACIAIVHQTKAQIGILEFIEYGGHQVIFNLNDKQSRYSITQEGENILLKPVEVTNVVLGK